MDRRSECRDLLLSCRPAWRAGHGHDAWEALEKVEVLADGDAHLQVEVDAMRAGLHLLAEQFGEAVACAERALACAEHLAVDSGPAVDATTRDAATRDATTTRTAVMDARVTLSTMTGGGPYPATGESMESALATLDEVANAPDLVGSDLASRAINNALNLWMHVLQDELHTTDGQVEAWMRVSEARTLVRPCTDKGNILRQAVDLGVDCGQWERAWTSAQEQIADETQRNELIAVLTKASFLAFHRGMRGQARDLGLQALHHSVAVDHPWVRTYAYLGGVIAAACGGGSLTAAVTAYARCTSRQGHATRPRRAWRAATVALESGCPGDVVEEFVSKTLPDGLDEISAAQAKVLLADARGQDVDLATANHLLGRALSLPDQARVRLAMARTLRRQGRPTAAALELSRARALLNDWPGWLLTRVEEEAELVDIPVQSTPAQRQVLHLLAEGLSNQETAARLDLSERTVAVHVAALLKNNTVSSRTALVARHLRSAMAAHHHVVPEPSRVATLGTGRSLVRPIGVVGDDN